MYDVGQVLFLLSRKNNQIIPSRVESVVTVKRLSGAEVTHQVVFPGHEKQLELEKLSVDVFTTANDLREHLLSKTIALIDQDILDTEETITEAWGSTPPPGLEAISTPETTTTKSAEPDKKSTGVQVVELENGMKARLHMPKDLL